jgi:hypothetical protein
VRTARIRLILHIVIHSEFTHVDFKIKRMNSVIRSKVIVVGDWAVGKTSIVQQILGSGTAFPKVSYLAMHNDFGAIYRYT